MTSIRVIAGKYGGRSLFAPRASNSRTKPMGERVRGALFNSLSGALDGAVVLDAFAGTGAVGIEAISRGADSVVFVERDRVALGLISKNIDNLEIADKATLISTTLSNWLDTYGGGSFDIIFADPPYENLQFSTVERLFGLLKPGALMVLSHTGRSEGPNLKNGIVVVDNRSYGNAHLTFFRRED